MNRDEHEEEDRNSNTNPRREDDCQGDLSRVIAEILEVMLKIKRDLAFREPQRYQVILLTGMQASIVIFINKQVITPRGV
jgi:hypothetical protein